MSCFSNHSRTFAGQLYLRKQLFPPNPEPRLNFCWETLVAGTPFFCVCEYIKAIHCGPARSENWTILCWLHHCTEDLSEKKRSPVGMFCPRRLSHSYLAIPHACTRQTGRYANKHRRKNVSRPDMSGQQSKKHHGLISHIGVPFKIEIHCEAKTTQDFAADSVDLSLVFVCVVYVKIAWLFTGYPCVHVSPLFLSVWGLDLFHLHSPCHVGLNVSYCCSFS